MARLSDVNTTDVLDAMRLGCRTMCSCFNADADDAPFFPARVRPDAMLGFSPLSDSHVPGRHLNALLNAEDAAGVRIDEECIDKHARAAFFSYGGTLPLPLGRLAPGGPRINFYTHDVREGFHALYSLVKYRDSDRARGLAEASIAAVFEYWDPDAGWDVSRLEGERGLKVNESPTFISGLARAIGPLVKLYRATGYGPALELATVLKEKCIGELYLEDGSHDVARFGTHSHSTTCVMSSLAQLADVTGDSSLMHRVKAFYDMGLREIRDGLTWSPEKAGSEGGSDRGEVNNSGDIIETALILGRWGYAEYYQDAERGVRGHVLPSQLRDVSFVVDPPNPGGVDGLRGVAGRLRGAFGFPAPYGHEPIDFPSIGFNLDIVGGTVGSLCEVYRETTRRDEAGHRVNLLFDHETPEVEVQSPYTHHTLTVRVKRPGPLFVRMPEWVDAESLRIRGTDERPRSTNGYLLLSDPPVNRPIAFDFPLPTHEITLEHRNRSIRTRLRGDSVVAMDDFGADLTFFEPLD